MSDNIKDLEVEQLLWLGNNLSIGKDTEELHVP